VRRPPQRANASAATASRTPLAVLLQEQGTFPTQAAMTDSMLVRPPMPDPVLRIWPVDVRELHPSIPGCGGVP
jgi:hypothetical protein